jgi:hypothetical protein
MRRCKCSQCHGALLCFAALPGTDFEKLFFNELLTQDTTLASKPFARLNQMQDDGPCSLIQPSCLPNVILFFLPEFD